MVIQLCHISRPDTASSFRICEASGLSLRVITCDWTDLFDLTTWLSAQQAAGVYVMIVHKAGGSAAYIGEGSRLWERLRRHGDVLHPVRHIFVVCCEDDYEKGAATYYQEKLSDRLQECGRLTRVGSPPARLPVPAARRQELDWQIEAAIGLLSLAGCSAFVSDRKTDKNDGGDA